MQPTVENVIPALRLLNVVYGKGDVRNVRLNSDGSGTFEQHLFKEGMKVRKFHTETKDGKTTVIAFRRRAKVAFTPDNSKNFIDIKLIS